MIRFRHQQVLVQDSDTCIFDSQDKSEEEQKRMG